MDNKILLASNPVFMTIQGEGVLCGLPMVFVRLGGCSLNCAGCDTDYRVKSEATADGLAAEIRKLSRPASWLWVTGGEPTDQNADILVWAARRCGLKAALATAGVREVSWGGSTGLWDFLSVSPHRIDGSWLQRSGDQLNIVPGLGGMQLSSLEGLDLSGFPDNAKFITPMTDRHDRAIDVEECVAWVRARRGWRLGWQAHKAWGLR